MTKNALRSQYKQKREELLPFEQEAYSAQISFTLISLIPKEVQFLHVFLPIERLREISTVRIKDLLQRRRPDIKWVISSSDFETMQMKHVIWDESTEIVTNAYGIPEPVSGEEVSAEKIDMIFVPLLAFDKKGHRLGYGKGFYDRLLTTLRPDCITVGLSLFPPADELLPADE
ncbi:MAG: 5-formyltetrahydrofolate cyclo-ligase, partial [Bacteroidota bacterium]